MDQKVLHDWVLENGRLLSRYANRRRRIGARESLYIVTGCIKNESWALAAYKDPMVPPNDMLRLVRDNEDIETGGTWYTWTERGTSEARSSEPSQAGLRNQSLFLRGLTLTFSTQFYASLQGDGGSTPRPPGSEDDACGNSSPSDSHGGGTYDNHSSSSSGPSNETRREGGGAGGANTSRQASNWSHGQQQSPSDIQIATFPENRVEVSQHTLASSLKILILRAVQTYHPSETVNKFMLEKVRR